MITPFLEYLLKANIAIALFYLFYRLFLQRDTFYAANRMYFIVALVFASVFPAIDFSAFFPAAKPILYLPHSVPELNVQLSGRGNTWLPEDYVTFVLVAGFAILLLRFLIQLSSLVRLYTLSNKGYIENTKVNIIKEIANPFSFFKWIFVNPQLHDNNDLQEIIAHENVHVKQRHSTDIVLFELAAAACWYNPFIWLMRKAMKQNIEFLADKYTLKAGYDRRHYQYNLLKVSRIPMLSGIVNNFNFNHLKNRIMMMNKKQSSKSHMLKFALVLPVFVLATLFVKAKQSSVTAPENTTLQEAIIIPNTNDDNPKKQTTSTADSNKSTKKESKTDKKLIVEDKKLSAVPVADIKYETTPDLSIPAIAFDKDVHDFGTIQEANGKVSAVFTFTNVGKAPLVVNSVAASCGCTTPEWTKEPVAPNSVGYIRATYDPVNRVAPFDKTITVHTNGEPAHVVLHIKGEVVKQ